MTKLKWGMIGGGEGSQIGPAHRLGARLDGLFDFTAGALDHRAEYGIDYGKRLGLGVIHCPLDVAVADNIATTGNRSSSGMSETAKM